MNCHFDEYYKNAISIAESRGAVGALLVPANNAAGYSWQCRQDLSYRYPK